MQSEIDTLLKNDLVLEARKLAEEWAANTSDDHVLALQYAGMSQIFCGDALAAEQTFRAALTLDPDLPRNVANLGMALMTQGKYKEGLPLYEARYARGILANEKSSFADMDSARQWMGEPLHGKRLLLIGEQGFGDQIQFIRFAAELRSLGASQIIAQLRPELANLLSTAPCVDRVLTDTPTSDAFDLWCPLLSTALHLQLEQSLQPLHLPYLFAPQERNRAWQQQLQTWFQDKPKIGLVWAGSPGNSVDGRRSLPFSHVLKLLKIFTGAAIVSLQIGTSGMESLDLQCSNGMIPLLDLLTDFSETAAVIENLDLVISVDTAVAHLAGALGKPVWLLLPAGPDWRWGLHEATTDWYPSMQIFRQTQPGDWNSVIASVERALQLLQESAPV